MRHCEGCGKALPSNSRRDRRFCSGACRQFAHNGGVERPTGWVPVQPSADPSALADAVVLLRHLRRISNDDRELTGRIKKVEAELQAMHRLHDPQRSWVDLIAAAKQRMLNRPWNPR